MTFTVEFLRSWDITASNPITCSCGMLMVMLPPESVELGVSLRFRLMTLMVELVMVVPPPPHGQPQPQPELVGQEVGFSHGQPVALVPAKGAGASRSQEAVIVRTEYMAIAAAAMPCSCAAMKCCSIYGPLTCARHQMGHQEVW